MELTDFFHVDTDSQKLKVVQKLYLVSMVKNGCDQSDHRPLKLTLSQKMNRWNKLIFCMLVQIQES